MNIRMNIFIHIKYDIKQNMCGINYLLSSILLYRTCILLYLIKVLIKNIHFIY